MRFARAAKDDPGLKAALAKVVVTKIDTHDDEGDKIAEEYGVSGIPHFALMRPDGSLVDRWVGYSSPGEWLAIFEPALADPTTIEEKVARFASAPTAVDAATLGRIRAAESKWSDAVAHLREAGRLDPAVGAEHAGDLFYATYRGMNDGAFSLDDVKAAAEAVREGANSSPDDLVFVARLMSRVAREQDDPALLLPYLTRALDASAGTTDEELASERKDLLVLEALHVKNDPLRAVELKKETMDEGWTDKADDLNAFAWWCFENKVNLEEAETLARKGVALAKPGEEKAMILDTVAEICNLRGDCGQALELITEAIQEDPDAEHYQKQKARFEELVAKQKSS